MKNIYFVVSINIGGRSFAYCDKVPECTNLKTLSEKFNNADIIQYCRSKKYAQELADTWNGQYKNNGVLLHF